MTPAITLDQLVVGQRAVVRAVALNGSRGQQLMEMGLLPGTPVTMVRFAPLGDPIDVSVRGYHLSLRRAEARSVSVQITS